MSTDPVLDQARDLIGLALAGAVGKPVVRSFFETKRDATLSMPKLIFPAVQVNMRAGQRPEPDANGTRYLKIPLNLF